MLFKDYSILEVDMNKIIKIFQCIKYGTVVLGTVGKGNRFEKGSRIESTTIIGDNNYFSFRVMSGYAKIGNYCSFGPDVKIAQSQHSIDFFTTSQRISSRCIGYNMLKEPAIIGNDVWIGANAVIMQGVSIGDGAVIGANAVVTKDIPAYGIAVGIPARVIKYRLSEEERKMVMESGWWNMSIFDACATLLYLYQGKSDVTVKPTTH